MVLRNNNTYNTSNYIFNQDKINISSTHLEKQPLLHSINKIANSNKPLSKLYKLISSTDSPNAPHIVINKWEKDLNIHTNHFRNKICIQYKIIHRTHITQHKMQII